MATQLERDHEILDSHWNYSDVLFLALAYLPLGVNRLTADHGRWAEAVEKAKEQLRTQAPELLAGIHFRYRSPLQPHSEQLGGFFMVAGISGKLEWSPSDDCFYLSEQAKSMIIERREKKLSEQHKGAIRQITGVLQKLVVSKEGSE